MTKRPKILGRKLLHKPELTAAELFHNVNSIFQEKLTFAVDLMLKLDILTNFVDDIFYSNAFKLRKMKIKDYNQVTLISCQYYFEDWSEKLI